MVKVGPRGYPVQQQQWLATAGINVGYAQRQVAKVVQHDRMLASLEVLVVHGRFPPLSDRP